MEIKDLLRQREGTRLEFMPNPDVRRLAESVVAFANTDGGTIVLGIDHKGRVHTDSSDDLGALIEEALQLCEPAFRDEDVPRWQLQETPDGSTVGQLTIRPLSYTVSVEGVEVYTRQAESNVYLPPEIVPVPRGALPFEETPVDEVTLDDLRTDLLDAYKTRRREAGHPSFDSDEELLRSVGAITGDGVPTVAGVLLFCEHPDVPLPQARIRIVHHYGKDEGEATTHIVTTAERYRGRRDIVGPARRMIEDALTYCMRMVGSVQTNGLDRQDKYEYPVQALREAIANAVCHRDYSLRGQQTEIRFYDDHVEIKSPGGLPAHITTENIMEEHYSRNPYLMRALYEWGAVEEMGQGMNVIFESMRRNGRPAPTLYNDPPISFTMTLQNATNRFEREYADRLNERQIRALTYLQSHESITNREYRDMCPEISSSEMARLDLKDLVEEGLLLRIGEKRSTRYVLKRVNE